MKEKNKVLNLRKKIKPKKDGLKFIKTVSVGIPFSKVIADITVRRELDIPIFHETIMKLIEEKWNNYEEIRRIMGLDASYLDNIILELGQSDYITHYGQQIYLTNIGKTVLNEMKSVKIEPEILDNLIINLLDGTIQHEKNKLTLRERINSDVCLSNAIEVDINYLIKCEAEIRDIYKERQVNDTLSKDSVLRDELYRVIRIQKAKIMYELVYMDIYMSDEDNSIDYFFNTGDQNKNEFLTKAVREQLKNHPKIFDRMYDTEYYVRNKWQSVEIDDLIPFKDLSPLFEQKKKLETLLNSSINMQEDNDHITDSLYLSDRGMLFKEYQDLIIDLSKNNPKELMIVSDRFFDLTGDDNIYSIIDSMLNKSKVYIGYMHKDFGTIKFIENIKKKHLKNKSLYLKELSDIKKTIIIADENFMVNIYYKPVKIGRDILFEEIPILICNKETIKAELAKLKSIFD